MEDLSSIPIPGASSDDQQPSSDELRKYWEQAQNNLQKISAPQSSFVPAAMPFYQPPPPDMFNGFNPAIFPPHMPPMYPPQAAGSFGINRYALAEQRLREVMPKGAVINPIVRTPNFRGNQRGMIRHPRPPARPSFQPQMTAPMQAPQVTVSAKECNFVYSDFFSRMIPESVHDFLKRSYDALPSESMKPQLEYYLKERIVPLLDSGVASKVNWDAEMLPHKINFVVSSNWTPVSKPATGANNVDVAASRKRPFQMQIANNSSSKSNQSNNPLNSYGLIPEPSLSKKERKKQRKQEKLMESRQNNPKLEKYLSKGIGFIKEGEEIEDAQRRRSRAMRFHDGGASSSSPKTQTQRIINNAPREGTLKQRFGNKQMAKKDDDEALKFLDRQQIERDLASLQGTYCPTVTEKYQLLLKRDNLLHLLAKLRPKSKSRMLATSRMGVCIDMCPEKERYCRQLGNLLHPYECTPDGKLNPALAVKDYSRSAADQDEPLLHELRPPPILQKTMDYLILMMDKSMPRSELPRWYDFTWSRTRAIRKEITQQMIVDNVTVSLVEKCARFHIYASYCMADLDSKVFDKRMNIENLSKCLQTLRHMYDDLAKKSIVCGSEPEFRSYDILLNLADSNVLSVTHTYHKSVREAPIFKLTMKLVCAYQSGNFVSFFQLIRQKATFLQACLCRAFFGQIRSKAFHAILKTYRPAKFPISKLTELLAFDNEEDVKVFMKAMDLHLEADGLIRTGKDYQVSTELSDEQFNFGSRLIESKLTQNLANVIAGGRVQPPKFGKPVESFVMDYYGRPPVGRRRN